MSTISRAAILPQAPARDIAAGRSPTYIPEREHFIFRTRAVIGVTPALGVGPSQKALNADTNRVGASLYNNSGAMAFISDVSPVTADKCWPIPNGSGFSLGAPFGPQNALYVVVTGAGGFHIIETMRVYGEDFVSRHE